MSGKSLILVTLQILTMIALIVLNSIFSNGIALVIQVLGVMIGIWAIISIGIGNFNIQPEVKSDSLITKGPYKWIRNPMYTAVILFFIPIVILNFNWTNFVLFVLLLVTLSLKISREEQFLQQKFGNKYLEYKSFTKRLIPFIL